MNGSTRRLAVATAMYLGALGLFGPPTYLLVVRAVEIVAETIGVATPLAGRFGLVVGLGSLAIAFTVAWEITLVRLRGVAALGRGDSYRALGRNLLLVATALAAGLAIAEFVIGLLQWGVAREQAVIVVLAVAVLAGLAWTAVRSFGSFRRGLRRAE